MAVNKADTMTQITTGHWSDSARTAGVGADGERLRVAEGDLSGDLGAQVRNVDRPER